MRVALLSALAIGISLVCGFIARLTALVFEDNYRGVPWATTAEIVIRHGAALYWVGLPLALLGILLGGKLTIRYEAAVCTNLALAFLGLVLLAFGMHSMVGRTTFTVGGP